MFVARTSAGIAAAATALPRLDALVFTGGIGETRGACAGGHRGAARRPGSRARGPVDPGTDTVLSSGTAGPCVLRVEAREDLICARQAEALLVARS